MTAAPADMPRRPGFAAQAARAMKAFPTLLRVGISEVVAYRAEFVVWILTTNMPLVMLALWRAVAAEGPVGRFDQRAFTAYYLGVLAVRLLTSSWVVWQLSMEIRDGTLAAKLLRPIHPVVSLAADHISAVPMRALVISPVIAILVAIAGDRLLHHDPLLVVVFAASLAGAWLLIFFTMVLMGALAFFVDSALGIFELWLGVHAILSGYLVPLEVLPGWLRRAADVLPFRFMLAFPVDNLVGLMSRRQALSALGAQWAYVLLFGVLALRVWRAGLRRFAAFGG
ncbi:MAG TPA: ABC-2 family transporter protein [Polyangia bacterium]|nr:ABC-2 family transporter protein [Polyangia bacterium]